MAADWLDVRIDVPTGQQSTTLGRPDRFAEHVRARCATDP
jgi:hypothetical protein